MATWREGGDGRGPPLPDSVRPAALEFTPQALPSRQAVAYKRSAACRPVPPSVAALLSGEAHAFVQICDSHPAVAEIRCVWLRVARKRDRFQESHAALERAPGAGWATLAVGGGARMSRVLLGTSKETAKLVDLLAKSVDSYFEDHAVGEHEYAKVSQDEGRSGPAARLASDLRHSRWQL